MRKLTIILMFFLFVLALLLVAKLRSLDGKTTTKELTGFIYEINFKSSEIIVISFGQELDTVETMPPFYTLVIFDKMNLVLLKKESHLVLPGKKPCIVTTETIYKITDQDGKTTNIKKGDGIVWLIDAKTNQFIRVKKSP